MNQDAILNRTSLQDLCFLKHRFFTEIRRNMFSVLLKPRRTLVKLISTSISSSTAFPQGEAFRFFFSVNGHMVLCINSSRIVVLDVTSNPPIVRHELKTLRRPLSATIVDDGSVLAVVSSRHQVNIYSLSNDQATHIQVLALNDVPRTLALSPTGGVLAIAYNNGGIEVHALGEGALSTERRSVRCAPVDSISFSSDGTMILGSSVDCEQSSMVTIAVPYGTETEAGLPLREIQTRLWTTQILFPETIQGYSHASLLPLHAECDGGWFLGYSNRIAAFKATRINNTNSGTTYFVSPPSDEGPQEPLPFMVPTADCRGELVALGFQESGLWLYGVPERLDIAFPGSLSSESHGNGANQSAGVRPSLRDNYNRLRQRVQEPNILLTGHKMTDMPGITAASWVRELDSILGRRLVAVAPGGINPPTIGEEDVPIDSGRVLILDFERSPNDGEMNEVEIEIGDAVPKLLKEPSSNMDTEVELERRRTRLHRDHAPSLRVRTAGRVSRHAPSSSDHKLSQTTSRGRALSSPNSDIEPGSGTQVPDIPYDNTQPRSRDTLQRAATAAATTRGRYNPRYAYDANRTPRIPHESDADNWLPPPPPYTREPDAPLPEYLRQTLLPTRVEPVQRIGNTPSQIRRSLTTRLESISNETPRSLPTFQRLNRLNTITGSRFSGRRRRNRDDETNDQLGRQRTVLHRRSRSSSQARAAPERQTEPRVPPVPQQIPEPPAQIPINNRRPSNPVSPTTQAPNVIPTPASPSAQIPPFQPQEYSPDEPIANDEEWQESAQIIQSATSGLNFFHPFTISTPELHFPQPPTVPEPEPEPEPATARAEYSPQHLDPLQPTMTRRNLHRRVSTDPTHSQSSLNDDWRRHIEEWNEHTIHETSKRSRRCIVM